MAGKKAVILAERIEGQIFLIRGHKVMLDADLATLYEVEVKVLNQAVKRNLERFPADFMFQLTAQEAARSRSQTVTLKLGRGQHREYLPYAFTEQGVAMLSSVLRSERAVRVNIEIMRAFVRLRKMLETHADLARQLAALENKYDAQFKVVFDAIRELMTPTELGRSISSTISCPPDLQASCSPTARCSPTSRARARSAKPSSRPTSWTAWSPTPASSLGNNVNAFSGTG